MRKYQQLGLVVFSIFCVTCLLVYRNENYRLKYVLDIMDFFGRQETIKENISLEYTTPLPIWQRIGNGFHAYSSFWNSDDSEIITIVVGMKHSIVSFNCSADLRNNKPNAIIPGKFGFSRAESAEVTNSIKESPPAEDFTIYRFICKIPRNSGTPVNVVFIDTKHNNAKHFIAVRNLKSYNKELRLGLVSCLNLINPVYSSFYTNKDQLLEYFYYHSLLQLDEFIVYDNMGLMTHDVKRLLSKYRIAVNVLPFNFPFEIESAERIKHILQMDCEMRTMNISQFFFVAQPNEFIYSDGAISRTSSLLNHAKEPQKKSYAMSMPLNKVCLNSSESRPADVISDNLLLAEDRDLKTTMPSQSKFFVYRSLVPSHVEISLAEKVPTKEMFVNRYVECHSMDRNDEATHGTWPTTVDHAHVRNFLAQLKLINVQIMRMKQEKPIAVVDTF